VKIEIRGGEAREEAEQAGEDDQSQIVLLGDAGVDDCKHARY
jgi:hypothetical protein